ncbi:proline-rich transmembrane protein 1-like [Ruditapes philippinarum]|uniref:proline-rich transmembrane protein 1-like n=1 Tax=Ruditapes philippinarum TaxID=129788 RepID=UPI00295B9341|nr:proline-rich transmembrane protein 1-like [Ruditapes philippinarum]
MAERAGDDHQPEDDYTDSHENFGMDTTHSQPAIPPSPQDNDQHPSRTQLDYGHDTNTTVVVNQPKAATVIVQQTPPDYMAVSILTCLCCFCPTGICAIYYADEANRLANAGNYPGARKMSDNAKKLIITSVIVGMIWTILVVVLRFTLYLNYIH